MSSERVLYRRSAAIERPTQQEVSAADMDLINVFALRALAPDDVIVREALVCNDLPDAYDTQFARYALDQVSQMLPGAPLLRNHATFTADDLPVGVWYRAALEQRDDALWTRAAFYMVREPLTESIATRMDGGVVREVSLSWWMARNAMTCSICGKAMFGEQCTHVPGEAYGDRTCIVVMQKIEGVDEASLVWKGGQYGTAILDAQGQERGETLGARIAAKRAARIGDGAQAPSRTLASWWGDRGSHEAWRSFFKRPEAGRESQ